MAANVAYLDEKEITDFTFKICKLLDGAPMSQALHILTETKRLLLDSHLVDLKNPRFQGKRAEFAAFCREST